MEPPRQPSDNQPPASSKGEQKVEEPDNETSSLYMRPLNQERDEPDIENLQRALQQSRLDTSWPGYNETEETSTSAPQSTISPGQDETGEGSTSARQEPIERTGRRSPCLENFRQHPRQQESHYLDNRNYQLIDGRIFDSESDFFADADFVPAHHIHFRAQESEVPIPAATDTAAQGAPLESKLPPYMPAYLVALEESPYGLLTPPAVDVQPTLPLPNPASPSPLEITTDQDWFNYERCRAWCIRNGWAAPPSVAPPSHDNRGWRGRGPPREADWRSRHPPPGGQ